MEMGFDELLWQAKSGSTEAKEQLFLMMRPLLVSRSMLGGYFCEDLYQELSRIFLSCIMSFQVKRHD